MRSGPGAPYSFTIQFYHTVLPYSKIDEKDSWWAKEGDSSDYGRDFIVRILGGLKRDRGRERGEGTDPSRNQKLKIH